LPHEDETFETASMHTRDTLMAVKRATKPYRANVRAEQEGSLLSQERANSVQDANLVELSRRLPDAEQRHASIWAKRLQAVSQPIPTSTLGRRKHIPGLCIVCKGLTLTTGASLLTSGGEQVLLG
jgi:hypothetical protein